MEREEENFWFVIDTNILIGALIKDTSFKAKLLKNLNFRVFYPDYGLFELEKFRDYICQKRERDSFCLPYEYALKFLLESITVIPHQLYKDQIPAAYAKMADIDPKDTPFLALALHLECPLWSDDSHLKQQSLISCYSTSEIVNFWREKSFSSHILE